MVEQSLKLAKRCFWFSSLVSKKENLPAIYEALKQARALEVRTIEMEQGNKKSRIVAWTFQPKKIQEMCSTWTDLYSVIQTSLVEVNLLLYF